MAVPLGAGAAACEPQGTSAPPKPTLAVSLRRLERDLAACEPTRSCSTQTLQLYGLTVIEGYVIDATRHDVLLFGQDDAKWPPLLTEDLIIALRSASGRYDQIKGNVRYISHPSLSIDPDPQVWGRLLASRGASEADMAGWCSTCALPQSVRVEGIPFDTHFSLVMLRADYLMKHIADGGVAVQGLQSASDLNLELAERQIAETGAPTGPSMRMNRFWFYPGANTFLSAPGTIVLSRSDVILLSQSQYLAASGQLADAGRIDPVAQAFACNFSVKYDQVAAKLTIYAQLRGLFRSVALAELLYARRAFDEAGYSPAFLLDGFHALRMAVPRKVTGVAAIRSWTDAQRSVMWRFPSCGGVSIDMRSLAKVADPAGLASRYAQLALSRRPVSDVAAWRL